MNSDAPYFFDARIRLLKRGRPLVFPLWRPFHVLNLGSSAAMAPPPTSRHLTFRHDTSRGDPVEALEDLLSPWLPSWLDKRTDDDLYLSRFELAASIVGDISTVCYATATATHEELATARVPIVDILGAQLVHVIAEHLIERIVTGQHRGA
ncbi:MAG: hypothetical protein IT195_12565 [Microthrixaceae bacterium]|nr:hypothetical protein [Microthrixaceae bacterium]